MPGLLRKLNIFAAADGLILQPCGTNSGSSQRHNGNGNENSCIRVEYQTGRIASVSASALDGVSEEDRDEGLEAYGLVGLLSVASSSFLISITQRKQVAQIQNQPIYTITNIALIPTASQSDARRAISHARDSLSHEENSDDAEETASEDGNTVTDTDTETEGPDTDVDTAPASSPPETGQTRGRSVSNIAEDVMGKKVRFGRFAANWLSRRKLGLPGLGTVEKANSSDPFVGGGGSGGDDDSMKDVKDSPRAGSITSNAKEEEDAGEQPEAQEPSPENLTASQQLSNQTVELLPKLLRYTRLLFSSRNFFFAYDYDLTRHVGGQEPRNSNLPLHKCVDPLFFWNRTLMVPFIDVDAHNFVLPLMQGFVGQREFTVAAAPETENPTGEQVEGRILGERQNSQAINTDTPKRDFLLTLISRRSIQRPGLRYLRRGVDDDGNTANTVETEQILSVPDWDPSRNVYSYLQVRGSIPLYFSQSPYSFKPVPVLHHSAETNEFAFQKHFRNLSRRYGKIQAVSLVDKHVPELKLGEQYERYAQNLNKAGGIDGSPLGMEWFDFHSECRGMKFENVSRLVDRLEMTLDEYGDTVVKDATVVRGQKGIVRTNCMDCLDRTGVAQCAFGQWALERALKHDGYHIDLGGDSSTQWFNTLWADNGDAISKQYSSTAALKGDYTRTRKRDYRGALNDLGLTLSRYFNNIVNDYFSQACIDYLLGNVSTQVFREFAVEMQTADPGISVQKLRQNAIETSCQIVISDPSEELLGGWTMLTPRQPNTLRTLPFEESVLLLTDAAVYSCHFDWDTDKVLSFERIDLRSISRITHGTYITSILTGQVDEKSNVGLVIMHRDVDENALRVNTRSLQSNVDSKTLDQTASASASKEWDIYSWFKGTKRPASRFLAFKALAMSSSVTQNRDPGGDGTVSEAQLVRSICEEIERAMVAGEGRQGDGPSVIEEADIISLADARKRTGYLEYLVYDIKKMVWA